MTNKTLDFEFASASVLKKGQLLKNELFKSEQYYHGPDQD